MDKLTREAFVDHLREALNHLQDPDALCQSPLASLFGVADRFDTFAALQDILLNAINALEPEPDEPPQSRAWRMYDSLYYRYQQQLSQQEIADQMGLGPRQVRREQHAALELLADHLYKQFGMGTKLAGGDASSVINGETPANGPSLDQELAWLASSSKCSTNLKDSLASVKELAQPLADQHQARLTIHSSPALPDIAAHPVALQQMLLDTVCAALGYANEGMVSVEASATGWGVEIHVRGTRMSAAKSSDGNKERELNVARRLATLSGGTLDVTYESGAFRATLTLPACKQIPVLVIDDNDDMLGLLKRYATGTRYQVIGLKDPEQAVNLACQLAPEIIVLDVMMPQTDGWRVLRQLRAHPATEQIPIVICTIVGQQELAYALGASDFVQKPVTRQVFLDALARQVRLPERESR